MPEYDEETRMAIDVLESFRHSAFSEATITEVGADGQPQQTTIPAHHVNVLWQNCTETLLKSLKQRIGRPKNEV